MTPVDLLLALTANVAWALNFIAGKAGTAHFPPLMFTAIRFAILLVVLLPWLRPVPGKTASLIALGVVMGICHFGLVFHGLALSGDVASVAIATQLYVPFSALLAVLWLRETMDRRRTLGVALAFLGIVVIGFDPVVFNHLDALAYIAAAAMMMAVGTIMMRRLHGLGVFNVQAWIALTAVPGLTVLSALLEQDHWQVALHASPADWSAPIYSALGASLVGHGIVYYLLGRYPVTVTAPFMLLTPILGVAFGVILWGDALSVRLLSGGALTIAGVGVITVRLRPLLAALSRKRR